jgi:orotate phosphoribosyltransferase
MTAPTTYLDKKTIAELTARMYLDTGAVRFMTDKPFIFTSGWASPVYNDTRWLISFPDVRSTLIDFSVASIDRDIGRSNIDAAAGGETAGIPFAAWIADRLHVPMQYVRKKPKGFGRGAQIEGQLLPGQRVLLVEDLATDGRSKVNFVKAIRDADGQCEFRYQPEGWGKAYRFLTLRYLKRSQPNTAEEPVRLGKDAASHGAIKRRRADTAIGRGLYS